MVDTLLLSGPDGSHELAAATSMECDAGLRPFLSYNNLEDSCAFFNEKQCFLYVTLLQSAVAAFT